MLTYRGWVTHICVNTLRHPGFRQWLFAVWCEDIIWTKWWYIVSWIIGNKFHWNFGQNKKFSCKKITLRYRLINVGHFTRTLFQYVYSLKFRSQCILVYDMFIKHSMRSCFLFLSVHITWCVKCRLGEISAPISSCHRRSSRDKCFQSYQLILIWTICGWCDIFISILVMFIVTHCRLRYRLNYN